jgi:hypothetical protein
MKLVSALVFFSAILSLPVSAHAGRDEKKVVLPVDECIVSIKNTDDVFRVVTNKHDIAIYRDKLKRASLIVQDGRTYSPKYDSNSPMQVTSVVSNDTGEVLALPAVNSTTSRTPLDFKQQLDAAMKSKVVMCKKSAEKSKDAASGEVSPTLINSGGGGAGSEYGEDWDSIGFGYEYTYESYWADAYYPDFDAAATESLSRDQQKACALKWDNCNSACDNVADAKGGACAVGTMMLIEFPVAAGLFGIACSGGVIYDKGQCKSQCGSIASCF